MTFVDLVLFSSGFYAALAFHIGMEDETFYRMVEEAVSRIRDQFGIKEDKWIDGEEAITHHQPHNLAKVAG